MDVEIPYGKENIKIKIDESFDLLIPKKVSVKDEDKLIKRALENPIGYEKSL